MVYLIRINAKGGEVDEPFTFPSAGIVTIGRNPGQNLLLPDWDKTASRTHAEIACNHNAYLLKDIGSTSGTFVNAKQITGEYALKTGDILRFGKTSFRFIVEEKPIIIENSPNPGRKATNRIPESCASPSGQYLDEVLRLQKEVHNELILKLKQLKIHISALHRQPPTEETQSVRDTLEKELSSVLNRISHRLPNDVSVDMLRDALLDEFIGYGPITCHLNDPGIEEVMVNGPNNIFVARRGKIEKTGSRFYDDDHVMSVIRRIVEPLGKHIDRKTPMADARLPDGSRVNAIINPLTVDGPSMTIRKFPAKSLEVEDLTDFGTLSGEMASFLREAVRARQNILVAGGTGSGKTTLLNVLSHFIPDSERLVTIEDTAELRLRHANLVRLESRPASIEGEGAIGIRELVINALRMRPDRIIVGECRGMEAFDMLQAMNTGHEGSLTTVHANSPRDAIGRLSNMVLMGFELPTIVVRQQIASAIGLIVHQARLPDGSRKVMSITEITGLEKDMILTQDIFVFKRTGYSADGKILGYFTATGNVPQFVQQLREIGDLRIDFTLFKKRDE